MTRSFYNEGNELVWVKNPPSLKLDNSKKIVWIDLQKPERDEQKRVEEGFGIEFFTQQEAAEIESSSRYLEDIESIEANSGFVVLENSSYKTKQVSFILKMGFYSPSGVMI